MIIILFLFQSISIKTCLGKKLLSYHQKKNLTWFEEKNLPFFSKIEISKKIKSLKIHSIFEKNGWIFFSNRVNFFWWYDNDFFPRHVFILILWNKKGIMIIAQFPRIIFRKVDPYPHMVPFGGGVNTFVGTLDANRAACWGCDVEKWIFEKLQRCAINFVSRGAICT